MPETGASESGSTRVAAVLQTHLDHLERPLRYATRQNFAHLAKLRDLEAYVQHHVQALQASPLPQSCCRSCSNCCRRCRTSMRCLCHRNRSVRQAEQVLAQIRAHASHAPSRPLPLGSTGSGPGDNAPCCAGESRQE